MEIYSDDPELTLAAPYLTAQAQSQVLRNAPRPRPLPMMPTSGVETPQPQPGVNPLAPTVMQPASTRPDYRSQSLQALQQANELATTMPDMTEAVDAYRRRHEAAGPDIGLAMFMGGVGGEMGKEMGGQILKHAMAARQPEKTAYGTLDVGGFAADPMKAREFRISRLETQAKLYETQAHNAETVEQRDAAAKAADATRREIAQQTNETRRMFAGAVAGRANERRDDARAAQVDRVGGQVMDDYTKAVKDERVVLSAFDNLKATAQKTDAASDIAFVFQYMKMLDPNSVVREGEFATAQNAAGIPDQIKNLYNRAMKGERLNPTQRGQFLGTAERLSSAAETRMQTRQREFEPRLRAVGADPTIYLPGYRAPAAPGGGSGWGIVK